MTTQFPTGGAPSFGIGAAWASLTGRQRNAFLASYLGWTLDAFDYFILVMVLRHVEHDFVLGASQVPWALFVTLAMRPVGALFFGLLADRFGRRPILMFNVAFFSLMELLSGLAPTWGWFLVLRALFGFGMGGEWGIGSSLVMESVPRPDARCAFRHLAAGLSGGLPTGRPGVQVRISAAGLAGHVFHRLRAGFARSLHPTVR